MSDREECISIINRFPEEQLKNIVLLLKAAKTAIDEASDDAFCNSLLSDYQKSEPDEFIPLSVAAEKLGVNI